MSTFSPCNCSTKLQQYTSGEKILHCFILAKAITHSVEKGKQEACKNKTPFSTPHFSSQLGPPSTPHFSSQPGPPSSSFTHSQTRLFLLTKTQPGIILPCKLSCFVVCDQICLSFSQTPTTHAAAMSRRLERDGALRKLPLSSQHQETQNRLAGASPQAHLQGRKGL